jgi:protein phosphatase-4 regulatory subunit 3
MPRRFAEVRTDVHLQQEEAKILVASEDDPARQLLETKISKDDGYQKQQGTTIIVGAK